MCWAAKILPSRLLFRLAMVLAMGALTGACFQPLYGNQSVAPNDTVRDKLASIDIPEIVAPNGTPTARVAVALRNALLYDLNGGSKPISPMYRLDIKVVGAGSTSVIVDVSSGRPDAELEAINVSYGLVELETKKIVVGDSTFARASYDVAGGEQRFARQRAWRNAEDRAIDLIAQNIRNRLASYFVAGT